MISHLILISLQLTISKA